MSSGYLTTMEAPLSVQPTTARKASKRLAATHGGGTGPRPIPPIPEKFPLDMSGDKVTSHLEGYGHAENLLGSKSATSTLANSASPTAFARPAGVAAGGAAALQFGGGLQPLRTDPVAGSATGATNPGMTMYDGMASGGSTAVPAGVLHATSAAAPPPAAPQTLLTGDAARLDRMEQQTGLLQQQIAQLLAISSGRSFGHNPSGTLSGQQAPSGNAARHQRLHEQALAEGDAHRRHLHEQQRQQPHPGDVVGADHHPTSEIYRAPQPQFHAWSNGRDTGGPPPHVQSHRPQDQVVAGYSRTHPGDLCLTGGPVPHPSALPTQQYDLRPPPFYVPHASTTPFMQRQYGDVAQPAPGAFAPNVSSVPEPWNLCGDIFANVNIASPELTAQAFGELHDLQTPLMYASKNCEQSYWERHNLISSHHQQNTLIKMSASGTCIEELKRRFASEAADARFANTSTVKEFTATPDAFDSMVSSMQSLCNSMSRPFRFGSLQHVFISQTRDFVLSLALFKATQLQAGVPWSDIMTRYRSLFASFAALRTFCEQRSARYGKVWFHVRLMAYLSHVSSSVTPWIDDGVRDSRAIITSKAIRDLESAQKSALSKLASEQSAALAHIEKAALAAASASKAAETSAAIRRRDQRLCKGCSVHAGADRRTLCHTRVGTDGSAVGCPNAAQAANYPANGYK